MSKIFDQDEKGKSSYLLAVVEADELQILVEVFPDGQIHVATRKESWDTWSPGGWSIVKEVGLS